MPSLLSTISTAEGAKLGLTILKLQDVIEKLRLHPFTCLFSLSNVHKKNLLLKGVVLCQDIIDHPEYLKEIGMTKEESNKAIEEATGVCGV